MGGVIAPAAPLWGLLMPEDRARVLEWARGARAPVWPPAPMPPIEPSPEREATASHGPAAPERFVSDMQAERRRAMRVRVWRDAGVFVAVAAFGAGVAIYIRPPVTPGTTGAALVWLVVLGVGVRYLAGRAKGRGVLGTPEGNAAYFAAPERYAVGGLYSASLGAGLGAASMAAALVAKGF